MEHDTIMEKDFNDWALRTGVIEDTELKNTELENTDNTIQETVFTRPINNTSISFEYNYDYEDNTEINTNDIQGYGQRTLRLNNIAINRINNAHERDIFERICHRISERIFDYINDRSINRDMTSYHIRSFLDGIVNEGLINDYEWYIDHIYGSMVLAIRSLDKMHEYRQVFDAFI